MRCLEGLRLTFLTNTLLETPITSEAPNLVVDNLQIILVVDRCQVLGGHGHTNSIGDALTKRSGGNFAAGVFDFRMTRRHRSAHDRSMVLLDLVHRPGFVSREVQVEVLQEACMARRKHESYMDPAVRRRV